MKKLVLILVSAVILTVFIALNYLLWDRENKIKNIEDISDAKNASIDTLGTEISNLKNENTQLKSRITDLEELNSNAQQKNSELTDQKIKEDKELEQKNEVINKLIQQTDTETMADPIKKWTEGLDKGQFESAYNLQYGNSFSSTMDVTLDAFTQEYKECVKSIKLKSVKLVTDGLPENRKGTIVFKAVLEVKKVENSSSLLFNDGLNERYFVVDFDSQKNAWMITDVLSSL